MGRRKEVTVDKLVECNGRVSPRDCDITRGGPTANGASLFDAVLIDGVHVEIVRAARSSSNGGRGGNRRFFVCPRCGGRFWYLYFASAGLGCQDCLGLRYASRHHLVNEQTWSGPTQRLPDGRKRRRKVVHFRHYKRRSYSQAGWKRLRARDE